MSARTGFLDAIEPALTAAGIRLVRASRASLGELQKPTAVARTVTYERTPQAPLRNVTWNGLLTLVSPLRDPDSAEQQLEDLFDEIRPALLRATYIYTTATFADWDEQHFCLDITITSIMETE